MISIITATFNSEDTIVETLKSVLSQTYTDWELLICDGGSKDKTLSIVEKFKDPRIKIVSKKDTGIFDAYNRGLSYVKGDIFGTLNSDDHYANDSVLQMIYDTFESFAKIDLVYGTVRYISRKDRKTITRIWKNNFQNSNDFEFGYMPAHPTVYLRNTPEIISVRYKPHYKYSGDFEYLLNIFFSKNNLNIKFQDNVMVNMLDGGTADGNIFEKFKHWSELRKTLKIYFGKGIGAKFIFSKLINRIKEGRV